MFNVLTPVEINKKEFRRAMRGYQEQEVHAFLDQVAQDIETLLRKQNELEETISQKDSIIKKYQDLEETLHNTLVVAQKTAEEVKQNAEQEAELIVREAQIQAEEILYKAKARKAALELEQEELYQSIVSFKLQIQAFLKAQLEMVENFPGKEKNEGFE